MHSSSPTKKILSKAPPFWMNGPIADCMSSDRSGVVEDRPLGRVRAGLPPGRAGRHRRLAARQCQSRGERGGAAHRLPDRRHDPSARAAALLMMLTPRRQRLGVKLPVRSGAVALLDDVRITVTVHLISRALLA